MRSASGVTIWLLVMVNTAKTFAQAPQVTDGMFGNDLILPTDLLPPIIVGPGRSVDDSGVTTTSDSESSPKPTQAPINPSAILPTSPPSPPSIGGPDDSDDSPDQETDGQNPTTLTTRTTTSTTPTASNGLGETPSTDPPSKDDAFSNSTPSSKPTLSTPPPASSTSTSPGTIAGIVLGAIAVLGLLTGMIFYFVIQQRKAKASQGRTGSDMSEHPWRRFEIDGKSVEKKGLADPWTVEGRENSSTVEAELEGSSPAAGGREGVKEVLEVEGSSRRVYSRASV